jgi:hypothetical protein
MNQNQLAELAYSAILRLVATEDTADQIMAWVQYYDVDWSCVFCEMDNNIRDAQSQPNDILSRLQWGQCQVMVVVGSENWLARGENGWLEQ